MLPAKQLLSHFPIMAPHSATKQRLVKIKQTNDEFDHAYLERIDSHILEGKHLGDEANVMGAVGGLKKGTNLWGQMTTNYPASYVDF